MNATTIQMPSISHPWMGKNRFIERVMAGNYQTCYLSWDLDPDPDPRALFHSSQFAPNGQNIVFYKNPAADALILDQLRRNKALWQES